MKKIRLWNGAEISTFTVNTILGVSGLARFPLLYNPLYWLFVLVVIATKTTRHTKSSTFLRKKGNVVDYKPWTFFRFVKKIEKDGLVNCFGLTNPGVKICSIYNKFASMFGGTLIINYCPDFQFGLQKAIEQAKETVQVYHKRLSKRFLVFEIDASCPNSNGNILINTENILILLEKLLPLCHKYGIAVILKLGIEHSYEFSKKALALGIDGFHAINTVPWNIVMKTKKSPLSDFNKGEGGVSGRPIRNISYQYCENLRAMLGNDVLIIYGGGILNYSDAEKFRKIGGKSAITACTWTRINIWSEIKCLWHYNK